MSPARHRAGPAGHPLFEVAERRPRQIVPRYQKSLAQQGFWCAPEWTRTTTETILDRGPQPDPGVVDGFQRRPDRPICEVFWAHRTHQTGGCCHGVVTDRAVPMRAAGGARRSHVRRACRLGVPSVFGMGCLIAPSPYPLRKSPDRARGLRWMRGAAEGVCSRGLGPSQTAEPLPSRT